MWTTHPLSGYSEFAMEILRYHCIEVSECIPMYLSKRIEVVTLLLEHYRMSSDQKRGQIRHVTMVDG